MWGKGGPVFGHIQAHLSHTPAYGTILTLPSGLSMLTQTSDVQGTEPTCSGRGHTIEWRPFWLPCGRCPMDFLGFHLQSRLFVAPMAGVTDRPFRQLCKRMGAGLAVSEMVNANSLLYGSLKTLRRANHVGEALPISVQIAGADPEKMADAARHNVAHGAQIIDINMGCPAKKVCNVMAGSALMQDEDRVARILEAVVKAVPETPVTLKCRTGWNRENRNVVRIAHIAEQTGIRALAIHGRTRADHYMGEAEYDSIAQVKRAVRLPVIANGDITSPEKARHVLDHTGADGLMIGRAAQGRPWIFREIAHYLETGRRLAPPRVSEIAQICLEHMEQLYLFYGMETGLKVARKHIAWYTRGLVGSAAFRRTMCELDTVQAQQHAVSGFFDALAQRGAWLDEVHEAEIAASALEAL
jgi:tRNA-dihydrouridine synthase B